jgi:hypothetical protein
MIPPPRATGKPTFTELMTMLTITPRVICGSASVRATVFKYALSGHDKTITWANFDAEFTILVETINNIIKLPIRCRRHDGKKWQCGACAQHGHVFCTKHVELMTVNKTKKKRRFRLRKSSVERSVKNIKT